MTKIERQRQKNREVHEAIARVAAKACKPVDQAPEQPANTLEGWARIIVKNYPQDR